LSFKPGKKKFGKMLLVPFFGPQTGGVAGGGGGGTQQSFIREGSAQMYNPLPFYAPFSPEKVPLSYTFY